MLGIRMPKGAFEKADRAEGYLYPVSFLIAAVLINIQFFSGLAYRPNSIFPVVSAAASAVLYLLTAYHTARLWAADKSVRRFYLPVILAALFFLVCYGVAIGRYGMDADIRRQLISFLLYGPLALGIGSLMGLKRREADFFLRAEALCYIAMPAALQYLILLLTDMNPYDTGGLGIYNYMQFSYALMPILFILSVQFVKGEANASGPLAGKRANALRFACIVVCWVCILGAATRGTILGTLLFSGLLIVYLLISRKTLKRALALGGVVLALFILLTYVVSLPGMERLARMNKFASNLAEGELVSASDAKVVSEVGLDKVVQSDSAEDYRFVIGKTVKNRITIYRLALMETKKAPLAGMSPFGFTMKYGSYPHNFALELLSEMGVVIGGLAVGFVAFCFLKLALYCRKDFDMGLVLVFLAGYAVQLMVSGTVWASPVLMFGMGYSLCYSPVRRGIRFGGRQKPAAGA